MAPRLWSCILMTIVTCVAAGRVPETTKDFSGTQQREGPECELPVNTGSCQQQFSRYYYDKTTGACQLFDYSGCGGNLNNFLSLSDCNERCVCSRPKNVGVCDNNIPRYFFNTATGLCQLFIYNGCGGNVNNFPNAAACENVCKSRSGIRTRCLRRPEFGSCSNHTIRYYYDSKCGCCQQFSYSGCQGNNNNFETEEQCLKKCEYVSPTHSRSDTDSSTVIISSSSSRPTTTVLTSSTPTSATISFSTESKSSTSTAATSTDKQSEGSGSRAIIIQTNDRPSQGNRINNIIQQLVNMLTG